MAKKRFQANVVAGRYTLPATLLIVVVCRVVGQALLSEPGLSGGGGALWRQYVCLSPDAAFYWGSFLLHVAVGWLLIVLNNAYAFIRTRASFQTSVYLLLMTVFGLGLYVPRAGDVASLLFVVSLFFLFRCYRNPPATGDLFLSAVCLSLGSLAVPQFLYLLPLYVVGVYTFQSLTFRGFFALLVGCVLPYWFLLAHAYWYGQMELFTAPFQDLASFQPLLEGLDRRRVFLLGYLFVLYAVSAGRFLAKGYEDKIRTRCYLRFFILMGFCLFVYVLLQPVTGEQLVPVLLVCVSILAGHLFVLSRGRVANVFFILALLGVLALFVYNLWMLS